MIGHSIIRSGERRHVRCVGAALAVAVLAAAPVAAQDLRSDSISLARSIHIALDNSTVLRDAEMQFSEAGHLVREAWASVMPDLRASASYARNLRVQQAFLPAIIFDPNAGPDDLIPVRFGSDNTWRATFSLDQPLFEAQAFIGVSAAGRFQDFQAERVRGTAQQVVSAVRQAYFDALLADEEVRLTEKSVERVRKTLDETRALNRAGLASEYDVLRLEVQLANLEPNLQRAMNAVAAAQRQLLVEMGVDPEREIMLEGSLSTIDLAEVDRNSPDNTALLRVAGSADLLALDFDELSSFAERRRTELRQIDATINLEEARRAAERAEFFPKLSAFSSYDITAQENGGLDFFGSSNQRTTSAVAGVRVEVPIFTGFSRSARVLQASARIRQNEARRERAAHETVSELRTTLENVEEARARAAAQRRAVEQAERGFAIASAEYQAGVGSQLQITDAEVALRESEFNYARAVYDYLSARARLEAAVGAVPDQAGGLALQNGSQ